MKKEEILEFYSNEKLQEILWKFGRNREVVPRNKEGIYFKRPAILLYPKDIIKQVELGAFSFHCSVEHWKNPLLINERNYDEQRIGFDWVIDIDSKLDLEEAKIAAKLVKSFLDKYNLNYFIKFSGRRGFHFIIFWENFPEEINYQKTTLLYPELPKILSNFLREKIRDKLLDELIKYKGSIKELTKEKEVDKLDPFDFVEIEKDWSLRHLFRAPYSLHEKTNLVSVIVDSIENFRIENAKIENVKFKDIERKKGDASKLIIEAYDFVEKQKEKEIKPKREIIIYIKKITQENFPPCIQNILEGIKDGRKRSVFTLITFLRNCNWPMKEVEKSIIEWGKMVGLKENYVKTQLTWHKKQKRKILPPNCDNDLFYKDIGICKPLPLCEKIKNPLNFAILKIRRNKRKIKKTR
jgi:DNA primase large subunit